MSNIIGICGFMGSGKDTVADYLVNIYGYKRESFANSLKDSVSSIFGWDREMLEGRSKSSREWREQVDTFWANRLGMPELTPRWVLQYWGTDVCRKHFHDDIWIASLEHKLTSATDDIVITDCRFPNELRAIKNLGGSIVRVKRGPEPDWYEYAKQFNKGPKRNMSWALSRSRLEEQGVHASEYSWVGQTFDKTLNNDGTIQELYNQVDQVLEINNSQVSDHLEPNPN